MYLCDINNKTDWEMSFGKTIELFLVNGTADSLVTAELSNWNGKAIKIPRNEIESCKREDICGIGVYFLFSKEDDGTDAVYIGEAENVFERLKQHIQDFKAEKEKYYWNVAVAFVGSDLNKALIRYLENRFVEIATESTRYRILTKCTFRNTKLKESQKASMEEFIANVKVIINTLGYKLLEPMPKVSEETIMLYCKRSGANGAGFLSAGGFTVLTGSLVSEKTSPSMRTQCKGYYALREKLIADGVIVDLKFQSDYEFNSPSAAATVLIGHSANGNTEWKTDDGTTLKEL